MVETEDNGGIRKKFLHVTPGHFTKHHVKKLVHLIQGDAETTVPPKPSLAPQNKYTPPKEKTYDDITRGEGLSEAMSIDAIREWRKP